MAIHIFDTSTDNVIMSMFVVGKTDNRFACNSLLSLINRLEIQRNIQDNTFYRRLEKDILKGCIMPPITIAFVVEDFSLSIWNSKNKSEIEDYINTHISEAFILDGIQRLNTLERVSGNFNDSHWSRALYVNIIICNSSDNLLYRMITLNNGQKPMTARHQIEILTANMYDFDSPNIDIHPERGRKRRVRGAFDRANMVKAYLAFLSNSTDIDNQKIIEEKLDELIATRIIDSNITEDGFDFSDVLTLIEKFTDDEELNKWIKTPNHLIGFSVGIKESYEVVKDFPQELMKKAIENYNKVFHSFRISKFNIGKLQREMSCYFIQNIERFKNYTEMELLSDLSQRL